MAVTDLPLAFLFLALSLLCLAAFLIVLHWVVRNGVLAHLMRKNSGIFIEHGWRGDGSGGLESDKKLNPDVTRHI